MRLFWLAGVTAVITACSARKVPQVAAGASCPSGGADSTRLACIALDTVDRSFHFVSVVLRYEVHGDSVRIVTMPDQSKNRVIDGMGIIWLRRSGAILSVAMTDSA
jgi:hypothetical protein